MPTMPALSAPSTPSVPALEGALAPTLFKIIKGSPTPEELAAVSALLTALAAPAAAPAPAATRPTPPGPATHWNRNVIPAPTSWASRA